MSKREVKAKQNETLLAKAAEKSQENVVKSLAGLKVQVSAALDTIANSVSAELQALKETQEAVAVEKAKLKELYGMDAELETLETLQEKIGQHKKFWAEEKQETERLRAREEEEYRYNLKKEHQQQRDAFEAELDELSAQKNAELDAREANLKIREEHLQNAALDCAKLKNDWSAREEAHKKELQAAVAVATNSLKKDLTHQHELEKLKLENELSSVKSQVSSLQERVAELVKTNSELDAKYKDATTKVQQIAEKAIEGASKQSIVVQPAASEPSVNRR